MTSQGKALALQKGKKLLSALLLVMLLFPLIACSNDVEEGEFSPIYSDTETNHVYLEIHYTNAKGNAATGAIVIELFPDVAPLTVRHFQSLVKEGFYDGLIFHRVDKGYLIQGGSPNGTGDGVASSTVKGEFSLNGVTNSLSHTRGTVSMARSDLSYDSASSQFFILQKDAPTLDGSYAAFGRVIHGMSTVDAISKTKTRDEVPLSPVTIRHAKFVIVGQATDTTTPTTARETPSAAVSLTPTETTLAQTTEQDQTTSSIQSTSVIEPAAPNEEAEFDTRPIRLQDYCLTSTVTDLVLLSISYTASNGKHQTASVAIRLDFTTAPQTASRFQVDVQNGSYDGISFSYINKSLMIQADSPTQAVTEEVSSTESTSILPHRRGVVSLLPISGNDTVVFRLIMLSQDLTVLDGESVAFGAVVYGMDAVDEISLLQTKIDPQTGMKTAPLSPVVITSAKFLVRKEN